MSPDQIIDLVRTEFECYGYVQWADIARSLGCSRQYVHEVVGRAVEAGTIKEDEYWSWRDSYLNALVRKVRITPDNWEWLEYRAELMGRSLNDVLNELINRERPRFGSHQSSTQSQSHDNNTNQDNKSD